MLYGRDGEREQIGLLLRRARESRSGALVVRGEPGIGKSALLEDTRERASDMQILTARPVESESELPFAALHQVVRPILGHVERLPPPQATALRVALGLEEGQTPERFLVFAAGLSLLSELAERRPVLCIVDDAQWLDTASAEALLFVARRLDAEGIIMLFGAREGDVRTFEAPDIPSLALTGLEIDAASMLLTRGATAQIAPAVLDRLVGQAQGNALALMELPSALTPAQLAGMETLPDTLPLTRQVESIFLARVRRLAEPTQRLLLVAAADDSEDLGVVMAAAAILEADGEALDEAERAGLLSVFGTRIDFRHPLVRSAVYAGATSSERRAAHAALAETAAEPRGDADRRAWHLAASVLEPDEDVVRELEDAAERAEARAGHIAASRARERAAELAANEAQRGRLLVGAARCASVVGADDRAVRLAEQAAQVVEDQTLRAEIARCLALAQLRRGRPLEAVPLLMDAARPLAPMDPGKALDLLLDCTLAATDGGDFALQAEISALAATIDPPAGDAASAFVADFLAGLGALAANEEERGRPHLERVLEAGAKSEDPRHCLWAGATAMWLGDAPHATVLLKRSASLARAQGAIGILVYSLGTQALLDFLEQRFAESELVVLEAAQFAREVGAENPAGLFRGLLALFAAIRGEDDEVRLNADAALAHATAHGHRPGIMYALWALGMLELGRGRWSEALAHLTSLMSTPRAFTDSLMMQVVPDQIEAAIRADREADAARALELFEAWAEQSRAPWAQPLVASCRGLVARGTPALEEFERALALADVARPFDLARIHLLYGEVLRRERRRADSRVELRRALDGFERIRATPWIERAASELRATGETARKRDPSAFDQLTPKEIQIGRLVAEGMSNKEVAAQLFLSPRTIDYHLRNVFSKLGLTSRTQLAHVSLRDAEVVEAERVATPA